MDEHDLEVKRHDLGMTAAYGPFTGSANYVNAKADPSQGFDTNRQEVAGVAAIKLADRWTLFGDMRYDIDGDQVIRDSIGLKYSDECFMLRSAISIPMSQTATSNRARPFSCVTTS